ncbi:mRNA 3'-end-processing protein rna14 [Zygosaccharomyces mellis]|uniref:mRNA 3'-end-processing protein RNA14 n=1 Tax=Zygosaccharomyces mellis TaxID=42258 RepID=A0A4C2EAT0_9SACH|nr:mRNA 3'-end-processing protein rna14 [Zygosaccharomyces mellis]
MSSTATPELSIGINQANGLPGAKNNDDVVSEIRHKIDLNPADILSYLELVQYYESKDFFKESREVYNSLHDKFPTYSPLWTLQLKGELQRDEFEFVEKMLAQCLSGKLANNDLPLWSTYLDYVRRRNNLITGGQEARAVVVKAFELVLDKCAIFEPKASQFWNDYLNFLEQWKPVNKWEEQQRLDMIRTLYKRMLCVPFENIEKMWNRYTEWEQDVNSLTARKFIGELSSEYMRARSLYQEWSHITKGLKRSHPVSVSTANKNNIPQTQEGMDPSQLQVWLNWIQWEKENKMSLSQDLLNRRLTYVYKQSVQYMLFAAEMWYDYAMYISDVSERQQILYTAVLANSDSPSLTFKLAESYESDNKFDEVKKCFEDCTNALLHGYQAMSNEQDDDSILVSKQRKKLTFVFCIYMNTMKRLAGLSAARMVFGKCRKLKRILTHDIYIENAYLEFQNQNDYKTPCKVLELGLKYFQTEALYVNKYLDFLILLNRDSQIKTLFETSIEKIQDLTGLKSIYRKMISYESKFGNLQNVYSLEKRFFERFPQENMIEIFTDRYRIQDENLIKKLELTYLEDDPISSSDMVEFTGGTSLKRTRETQEKLQSNKRQKNKLGIPEEVVNVLAILPKRQYFKAPLLDPQSLINYLNDQVELPSSK